MILLEEAASVIREKQRESKIHRTPTLRSESLTRITGGEVFLKLESLQKTGSFKIRGAYFAMYKYIKEGYREFITASSGNHAQGVAYAAQLHGVKATVVMPETTPWLKVKKTQDYGANVILYGESYYEAEKKAMELVRGGVKFLHAYNDWYVISGQATLGLEIVEDVGDVDVVVVPIGGGGLISGVAYAVKKRRPGAKVIGVQASGAPAVYLSLKEGRPIVIEKVDTIADGIAIKSPGDITLKLIQEYVDDVVLVDDNEIVDAIYLLLERTRVVAEGAGAVAVAALMSGKINVSGKKVVAVVSGGNIDAPIFMRVLMKAMARQRRVIKLVGEVPDKPGTLAKASSFLASHNVNILEVFHERYDPEQRPNYVRLIFVVEIPGTLDVSKLLDELEKNGFFFRVASQ
ncbi:threonine ammonia-lyase [Pyrobaculum aerophilum]|uniref:threonine ammonia-lyase n=2 Tax=Pyrobaculum aerophilum TaxID=13773 RepID=Q8ZVF0_PYRAE|nr:threonine ammonia-lyase [Pyrobaculum aerophilum]AAL64106.1 threonine dehydratase (ilvA) [Pyrobaculum aerophilum str. IM2]MCX8135855.1 threonine ammonia-lyase [Pyrobaculum aerophilum]HII47130.1 threonine ammonia-lyase [Pyrobaculum aerophilum]